MKKIIFRILALLLFSKPLLASDLILAEEWLEPLLGEHQVYQCHIEISREELDDKVIYHIYGNHPELGREAYIPLVFEEGAILGDEFRLNSRKLYYLSFDSTSRSGLREKLRIRLDKKGHISSLHIETYKGPLIFRNYEEFVWCDRRNANE